MQMRQPVMDPQHDDLTTGGPAADDGPWSLLAAPHRAEAASSQLDDEVDDDAFWRDPRSHWGLDPSVTFLNNGSFGAVPRVVRAYQDRLRDEMEREPVDFLYRTLPARMNAACDAAASFLRTDPGCFVFVPNATTAVNTVLAAMKFPPGSALATTDHVYPAVLNTLRVLCAERGWRLDVIGAPLPAAPDPEVAKRELHDAIVQGLASDVRMLVLDEVASCSGLIFPVAEITRSCRARGILTLIDAAHAPGMLPIDLDVASDSTPDFWTGNFHKWVFTPRGSAALVFRPEHRSMLRPLVISLFQGRGPADEFMWTGTYDPTSYLSTVAGIAFMNARGADRVRAHNNHLVRLGQDLVRAAVDTDKPIPDSTSLYASLALVEIPPKLGLTDPANSHVMMDTLFLAHRVEVPFTWFEGRTFIRLSAQLFNQPDDYARLAEVLPDFLQTHRRQWQ